MLTQLFLDVTYTSFVLFLMGRTTVGYHHLPCLHWTRQYKINLQLRFYLMPNGLVR
jgi:hypothetical protein